MAYNVNAPTVGNNILDDIGAIKNNLDELRKNEGNVDYPKDLVAGMTFSKYEPRDDDPANEKVVVYLRNRDNDGWLKIYDEEYGVDADLYKGNDIDSNGDGKVDSAEEADHALTADSANNADTADSADDASKLLNISGKKYARIVGADNFSGANGDTFTINTGIIDLSKEYFFVHIDEIINDTSFSNAPSEVVYELYTNSLGVWMVDITINSDSLTDVRVRVMYAEVD